MALGLNEETKTVVKKEYDRCVGINIVSHLNDDTSAVETVYQQYERVLEIDGVVINKMPSFQKMYDTAFLLDIKWLSPWGKEITGLDVMAFIKQFNDNFEVAIATKRMPT